MPKDVKELLVILDNLEIFSEKMLSVITDESEQGSKRLIAIIKSAKENYQKPIDSWFTGWFYQYTRVRTPIVEKTIEGIKAFPDAVTRLQEFKLLVFEGKWNEGSFNYCLFNELINTIPGYEPLKNELKLEVILRLKELIKLRMDTFINEYKISQKQVQMRKNELEHSCISQQKSVDHILLYNDFETAKKEAVNGKNNDVFCLSLSNKQVKLKWLDFMGGAHTLQPAEELTTVFVHQQINDVNKLNSVQNKRIKKECLKARDIYFEKIKLLVNPKDITIQSEQDNLFNITTTISSTFILRGTKNHYTLCWVNSLGKMNDIFLNQYPKLNEWLNNQDVIKEDQYAVLKTYLFYVKTNQSLGMDEFKQELSKFLSQGSVKENKHEEINKHKRLNFRLFRDVENHLKQSQDQQEELSLASEAVNSKFEPVACKLIVDHYGIDKLFAYKYLNEIVEISEDNQLIVSALKA